MVTDPYLASFKCRFCGWCANQPAPLDDTDYESDKPWLRLDEHIAFQHREDYDHLVQDQVAWLKANGDPTASEMDTFTKLDPDGDEWELDEDWYREADEEAEDEPEE